MSERKRSLRSSGLTRFLLEAGFIILVGVVAAVLDLGPLAIVVVMGIAWVAVAVFERATRPARPHATTAERAPQRSVPAEPPEPEPAPELEPRRRKRLGEPRRADGGGDSPREWNLWELERRAREHAGADAVPDEWAAIFMSLREFAKSDGALPSQFDSLVRESFPELTRTAT